MRVRDGSRGSGSGQVTTKMSTLDYLVTKVKRHVRASSADSAAPPTPVIDDVYTVVMLDGVFNFDKRNFIVT
ncbi:hypothetical protein Pcinc_043425 [Petrolisthes cinctipes]|uniref:Uncharacterized protein n=1 Tax=Petrolisthes cinctipes TaxID=88211 RepID=A0AAE1BJ57_PETCI|nr:hypothetical protein Pcinc_043425 [Petrolisthes cinctipes]